MFKNPEIQNPEGAAESIVGDTAISLKEVFGRKGKERLVMLGLEDSETVLGNLKGALDFLQQYYPKMKAKKVFLKKLGGQEVGKAEGETFAVDPWAAMDLSRLLAVMLHEAGHIGKKGKIQNEAVVEKKAQVLIGMAISAGVLAQYSDIELPNEYTEWLAAYDKVLDRMKGTRVGLAMWVWEMCSEKDYNKLWAKYKKDALSGLQFPGVEYDQAFQDFCKAFPELSYVDGDPNFGRAKIEVP